MTGESKPFIRNVFTLNTCANIVGSDVLEYDREAELLAAWQKFVEEVDPDLVIGYNTSQFDVPYLMDRAKALKVTGFPYLGRLKGVSHLPSLAFPGRDGVNRPREEERLADTLEEGDDEWLQASNLKSRTRTSRRKRTGTETRKRRRWKGVCNSTCSKSCSETTSCDRTR